MGGLLALPRRTGAGAAVAVWGRVERRQEGRGKRDEGRGKREKGRSLTLPASLGGQAVVRGCSGEWVTEQVWRAT
jgi:hypothetical protein